MGAVGDLPRIAAAKPAEEAMQVTPLIEGQVDMTSTLCEVMPTCWSDLEPGVRGGDRQVPTVAA